MAQLQPVLIDGQWRPSKNTGTFSPLNPATRQPTGEIYPVSSREEVEAVIEAEAICRAFESNLTGSLYTDRLPPELRDQNPTGRLWRCIDGAWTQGNVAAKS